MNTMQERKSLEQKFIKELLYAYWPLKLQGFNRFDIVQGKITESSTTSTIITLLVMFVIDICALYTLYMLHDYLYLMEKVAVTIFSTFQTCVLLNTSLTNKGSISKFLNTGIEIDNFIGIKNTRFMRNVSKNAYVSVCIFVAVTEVMMTVGVAYTYPVAAFVQFAAGLCLFLLYNIYYDFAFFLALYTSLTLRIRYLNVAIMKMTNFNIDHLPDQYPFNTLFWNKKFDKIVDFHKRADSEKIIKVFIMIFEQVRYLENSYRFTIFCCLAYLTSGTFATVQMFIFYAKSTGMDPRRGTAITGWCVLSWLFQFGLCQQTDMFQRQINQTTLICTYIQLRPNYSEKIYKLVGNVLKTLEVRDPRISIYGFFYFDTGLLLKIGATVFVYVTMQLQIAFPRNIETINLVNNVTSMVT